MYNLERTALIRHFIIIATLCCVLISQQSFAIYAKLPDSKFKQIKNQSKISATSMSIPSRIEVKNYIHLSAGYSLLRDKLQAINTSDTSSSKGSFLGAIGMGYLINHNWGIGVTAGYAQYKYQGTSQNGSEHSVVDNIRLMMNSYWYIPNLYSMHSKRSMKFLPYLMAGIGYAGNNTKHLKSIGITSTTVFAGKYKGNFAWEIGAGVEFNINRNAALDMLYKYVHLGSITSGNTHFETNNPLGTLGINVPYNGRLTVHEFLIGYRFKF